jgi:REP element-mobilizing transposase RayT
MLRENHRNAIDLIIKKQSKEFGVQIYSFVNVGNHLHILVRAQNRNSFKDFLRAVSGLIARKIIKRERGLAKEFSHRAHSTPYTKTKTDKNRFWDHRPFTRIVDWGRAYKTTMNYLNKNKIEAIGFGRWVPIFALEPTTPSTA